MKTNEKRITERGIEVWLDTTSHAEAVWVVTLSSDTLATRESLREAIACARSISQSMGLDSYLRRLGGRLAQLH
jgi:hypothetical protein